MAPSPNNTTLYAERPSVETAPVSWRDDASPAVFETKNSGVTLDMSSASPDHPDCLKMTQTSPDRCSCRSFPSSVVSLLKQLWVEPKYFRWVMTIIISAFFGVFTGFFNSFGPLYLCLRRDLHSSAVGTGMVASIGWSLGILSPFVNVIYQRLGPRKIAIMGALLCFVGILSSSFVSSIWPMYVTFGLLFGVGVMFIMTGSMSLIASHFSSNECALPTALPGIGGAIGMLVYSPLVELAYDRFGWRTSLRFISVLILVTGLISAVWNKRPASQKRKQNADVTSSKDSTTSSDVIECPSPVAKEKEAEGKAWDDTKVTDESQVAFIKTKDRMATGLKPKQEKLELVRQRRQLTKRNYINLAKDPLHWMFCLATMLSNIVMLFNIINLVELITAAGFSQQQSAMFMSILSFCETTFRILTGIFGDRLPCARILTLPVVCVLSACSTFSLTISSSTAFIVTYVCVAGIGRGVIYSIIFSASIETFGHAFLQESFSFILVAWGVACFPAAIIPGLSFDLTGSYHPANYCGAVLLLISAALFLTVYLLKNRKNRLAYMALQRDAITGGHSVAASLDCGNDAVVATCSGNTAVGSTCNGIDAVNNCSVAVEPSLCGNDAFTPLPNVLVPEYCVIVDKVSTV